MALAKRLVELRRRLVDALDEPAPPDGPAARFAQAALEKHKREGMELALRARFVALGVLALLLPFIAPWPLLLWYEGLLALLAINGWFQRRVARVGQNRIEVQLIFVDLLLMTAAIVGPNPLDDTGLTLAAQYRFGAWRYLLLFLGFAVLAYHWRTVWGVGVMSAGIWMIAFGAVAFFAPRDPAVDEAVLQAFGPGSPYLDLMNPNQPLGFMRLQEAVLLILMGGILAVASRRNSRLLLSHAALERERANLGRYFSPNVVEELSRNDEPLKRIRTQPVAVLFVDLVGFTGFADGRDPEEVIGTLRGFHARMEAEVFRHGGTLDKYLGDGLMATFGTPVATDEDAASALRCALAMLQSMADWNAERAERGETPLRASFGVHHGEAVLGDIGGSNRLEFAVIGDAVNVASRVEALTRPLGCTLAATDAAMARARADDTSAHPELEGFARREDQQIRGLDRRMTLWTYG